MTKQQFLKEKVGEIILLLFVPLTFYYLIPFPYSFIAMALSIISSAVILFYIYKESEKNSRLFSSKGFLVSFYSLINNQKSVKESYEISSKYLNSYYQIKTYEEICEDSTCYDLNKEIYFPYIINKDKENEAMLANYTYLYEEANKELEDFDKKHKKEKRKHIVNIIVFGLSFFLLAMIFILYPKIKESINNIYYLGISLLSTASILPLLELNYYFKLKEENKNEK